MNVHKRIGMAAQWARNTIHAAIEHDEASRERSPSTPLYDKVKRLHTTFDAARAIRHMRSQAHLSQQEFAAMLGVTVSEITVIEVGEADCVVTLQMCDRVRMMLGDNV